jgi:hypothetical protein
MARKKVPKSKVVAPDSLQAMAESLDVYETVQGFNDASKKNTEHILQDKIYNGIIDRYSRNGKKFEFSDKFVWSGSVYALPEIFGYIIFFAVFYFLGNSIYNRYGVIHFLMFFFLLGLWRLNILISLIRKLVSQ